MKKFIACFLLVTLGLCCKKDQVLCGCSQVDTSFIFIVKDQNNKDLLDPALPDSYPLNNIRLNYNKEGIQKNVVFGIFIPFDINPTTRFNYHYISADLARVWTADAVKDVYLDFGNGDTDTITFDYTGSMNAYSNVLLNGKPMRTENSWPELQRPVYYVVK